jgi:hypothetical protein
MTIACVQGQTLFERDMKALYPAELERVKTVLPVDNFSALEHANYSKL